jgi:hypothetical protein
MKTPPSAIMQTARSFAQDATRDITALIRADEAGAALLAARDPLDELVDRVRPVACAAVDALQVAAVLEADGITDRSAQVQYGFADVFALAAEVRRRAGAAGSPTGSAQGSARHWLAELRDIGHGVLYLLPAAVFPAVFAVLGRHSLLLGILVAGAIGWVWAGAAAWLAYRLLGRRHPGGAGRMLRWLAVAGLPVTATASMVIVITTGAGYGLVALAVGQMAYQMASTILVFYRREAWLFLSMLPAVLVGIGYTIRGPALLPWAIGAGIGSTVLVFALALGQTAGRSADSETGVRDGLRGELRMLGPVVLYTALSALYLLHAQAPYILHRFDVAVAVVPLMLGMGVVEWRARRFGEQARALLHRVRYPAQFVPRIWLLLIGGLVVSVTAVALLAVAMFAMLRSSQRLGPATVIMAGACVLLAGAYYLGFLLANMGRYGWLCWSLALCVAVHLALVAAVRRTPWQVSPLVDTSAFLGSTVLLTLLFLYALGGRVAEARQHR